LNAIDGTKLWDAETGYYINGGSAVSTDGKIVFGGCDAVLHVHDAGHGQGDQADRGRGLHRQQRRHRRWRGLRQPLRQSVVGLLA